MRITFILLILIYSISGAPQAVYAQAVAKSPPRVVVDILPVHELVSELLLGITLPDLLVEGAQSPHFFQLKPSQAELLARADVVILVGGGLIPPLEQLGNKRKAQVIELTGLDLELLKPEDQKHEDEHQHAHTALDPHLWLDPLLMRDALTQLANRLGILWPEHAATLSANLETIQFRLNKLDADLRDRIGITPARMADGVLPYVFYHDAYRYFEHRYGLTDYGSLFVNPPELVGAREQVEKSNHYGTQKIHCLITESESPLVKRIAEQSGARIILMQPTLLGLESAAFRYDAGLLNLADTLLGCEKQP